MEIECCSICAGSRPIVDIGYCKTTNLNNYQVFCQNCRCSGPICFTKSEAISHWNNIQQAYTKEHR
jgi:hypothetical protein